MIVCMRLVRVSVRIFRIQLNTTSSIPWRCSNTSVLASIKNSINDTRNASHTTASSAEKRAKSARKRLSRFFMLCSNSLEHVQKQFVGAVYVKKQPCNTCRRVESSISNQKIQLFSVIGRHSLPARRSAHRHGRCHFLLYCLLRLSLPFRLFRPD